MCRSRKRCVAVLAWAVWLAAARLPAAEPIPAGVAEYLAGLSAIQEVQPAEAVEALSAAIEADEENADYYTARGVAHVLAEALPKAIKDLERSLRLRPGHDETRMWLASAVAMTGDFARAAEIYPFATRDEHESFVRAASHEYGELAFRQELGETGEREEQMRAAALPKLAEGAADFARRAKGDPRVAGAVRGRGKELYEQEQYAQALVELEAALAAAPDDTDALYYHASCLSALGVFATAREEFTRVLTARTDYAQAYLGRALVAARLGDAARAKADLKVAARLAPAAAQAFRPRVDAALGELPAKPPTTEALVAALEKAAREDAPWDEVLARASDLKRAVNGRKRQHDEWYQEQLRILEDAVRAEPKDPDRLTALARFLYEQSSVQRERVEPRGPFRLFRYQTDEMQQAELARAGGLADQALAINPRHIGAMAVKASVLNWHGAFGDSEQLLRRALKIQPNAPEILALFSSVLEVAAAQKSAEANELRSPMYLGSRSETVGDFIYTYTSYRYPSQQDLDEAERLDELSQALIEEALQKIQQAAQLLKGTAEGFYYQGLYHWRQQELEEARQSFEQAIALDPKQVHWHFNLAGILSIQGKYAEALEARLAGTRRLESSAALLLELCWDYVARTKWKTARETLKRAMELDARDARVLAYQGVVAAGSEKPEDARVYFTMALALEEVRLRLAGRALDSETKTPLSSADYGLSLTLRRRLGNVLLALDRPEQAAEIFLAAQAIEPRVRREDLAQEIPTAMLPDADMNPDLVPEADNILVLAAWCRVGAGEALNRLDRHDEAIAVALPVQDFRSLLINGFGGERLRGPEVYSAMHLARAYLAQDNLEQAGRFAGMLPRKRLGGGQSLSPFAELEEEGSRLQEEVRRRQQGQREAGDESSDEYNPPDEAKVNAALQKLGPAIGHPEMGDGNRRFTGDASEVTLCIHVQQGVQWIVGPKSTRWRKEIVSGISMLRGLVEQYEENLEFARQRITRSNRPDREGRSPAEQLQEIDARSGRVEKAIEELIELAVASGYPRQDLDRDLEQ